MSKAVKHRGYRFRNEKGRMVDVGVTLFTGRPRKVEVYMQTSTNEATWRITRKEAINLRDALNGVLGVD